VSADEQPEAPAQWAVLELMGHRQAIGRVAEATLFGRAMVQVDRIDTEPEAVQYYGPESIYCLTPVTEEQARTLAKARYKTRIVPPALTAASYADDDDDEVWGFTEEDT